MRKYKKYKIINFKKKYYFVKGGKNGFKESTKRNISK